MKNPSYRHLAPVAVVLILSTLACLTTTKAPSGGTSNPAAASGDQNLPEPAAGLGGLKSYQAQLNLSFTGTQDGETSQWSTIYSLVVEPAAGTHLLSISSTGQPADSSLDGWVAGYYAGMVVERPGTDAPCQAQKNENDPASVSGMGPGDLLPPVTGATAVGAEEILGLNALHSTFGQASIGFPGKGTVNGEMWLAADGGYLVKYDLSAEGGPDFFGQQMQGTMTWHYQLIGVNGSIKVDLPEDCPAGLIDAPLMDGAQVVDDQPGLQEFEVPADVSTVMKFYQEKLPPLGYTLPQTPLLDESGDQMAFTRPGFILNVVVEKTGDSSSHVLLELERAASENNSQPVTPEPTSTVNPAADVAGRLGKALSLLLPSSDKASPLGSYHLEVNESVPGIDKASNKIAVADTKIKADVEASNYYFQHTQAGKTINDGYMIDGQEYDLQNGKATQGVGMIGIDWASWSLDIFMPYSIATLGPTPKGQENVDGRPADVFDLDTAKADPLALSTLQSMNPFSNLTITAASGTVWLDQQTGAMLKLTLAYTADIKDAQGTTLGEGNGQIDLLVSQVGAITVKLP